MTTAELVGKYYEAYSTGDFDALRSHLAPDVKVRGPMQSCDDADAYVEATRINAEMFAGASYRPLTQLAEGNEAVILGTLVMGEVELPTAEYFRVADGKIAEIRLYFDRTRLGHA